ncbi:beta-ketoacyl-ACP synthase II [bacterium]|nr:beta-ketoacyl-ACP synthase II [bacterium]MBU1064118.1 beta-ketoacyl-ACP synthase II [bacterium]MBU1634902.1 beta-ketoacyl-ACP synthase II [bacterium]MBU1872655.1 beta-ketoacyl-ACP synthase II [bacterium]
MEKRVVVTGMGIISPIGNDVPTFWLNLINGVSGVDIIKAFSVDDLPVKIGAEVKNFDPTQWIDLKESKRMDPVSHFGIAASEQAIRDAGLNDSSLNPERIGVIVGSGIGGIQTMENQHSVLITKSHRFVSPFFIPMMIPDIIPGHIAINHGFMGPNYSVTSACATSSHTIGIAMRHILCGDADVIIAGGSEASISPISLAGFTNMKALSRRNDDPQKASRPFDRNRDGFVIGEGAGIVILEELEHAMRRSAPIYAEIIGYGFSGDAHHITAPHPEGKGQALAIRSAINMSGMNPEDFGYINAHGTSTPLNDKYETIAIKSVFGQHAYDLSVSSTKSMTGHLLGAAGAIEFIALCLALRDQIIPPTINYEVPDPDCDLNYTPNKAIEKSIHAGLSSNFGFGGHNAVVTAKIFEP